MTPSTQPALRTPDPEPQDDPAGDRPRASPRTDRSSTRVARAIGALRARPHRLDRAVPRLPGDPDAAPLRPRRSSPRASGSPSRTRSASRRSCSARSRSPSSRWSSRSRSRCSPRCTSASTPRAGCKSTLVSLVDLMAAVPSIVYGLWGVLPAPAARHLPVALAEPVPRLDPVLPGRHRPERGRAGRSRATPRRRSSPASPSSMMVDPAGLRRHARRLRPGAARRARGGVRARRDPLGHDPHRRAAVRPRRHHRRHDARPRPRARRDHRRPADHLAGVRHQVPHRSRSAPRRSRR